MAQQVLQEYKSRRNRACLVQSEDGRFVVKTFREEAAFQKELQIYRLLNGQLPCAKVICEGDQTLTLTRLPGQTLVECLQQQEQAGLPVIDIQALKEKTEAITGKPQPIPRGDRIVANVIGRNGEVQDYIYNVL